MQIIPLFLVVCTCLGASWGVKRGKLTPYAHRYAKAHECKRAQTEMHTKHTLQHHTRAHTNTQSWAYVYPHTRMRTYPKCILICLLGRSFRAPRPTNEQGSVHNHADSCKHRHRHVHNHQPTPASTQMLVHVWTLSFQIPNPK